MTTNADLQYGLAHCVHHNTHFEFCYGLAERQQAIRGTKPVDEQDTRLANLWMFPADQLHADIQKADADMQQANAAYPKTYDAKQKTFAARQKTFAIWKKADTAWQKAYDANLPAIQALHDKLVAEGYVCTWNGTDIFTRETK